MVDLPRHVRGRANPTGRMYFSFEKFRGRPHAWPVIPLPFSPQDDEFRRRCRQCDGPNAEPVDGGMALDMARPLAAYRTAWQRDFTSKGSKGPAAQVPEAKAAAMLRLKEGSFVLHGLRKNAVTMLLEAGNTEAEVSAIVEMSEQMVRHYSRDVNKRRLAINGMKKLEECWEQTRANLFGDGVRHG